MSSTPQQPATGPARPWHRRIVVGVDGSAASVNALLWAVGEAAATSGQLDVVCAWNYRPYPYLDPVTVRESALEEARQALAAAQRDALGGVPDGMPVHLQLLCGAPGPMICHAAVGASLVVVGASRHGELSAVVLGSVAMYVVAHAPAPVVVVPSVSQRSEREDRELAATLATTMVPGTGVSR